VCIFHLAAHPLVRDARPGRAACGLQSGNGAGEKRAEAAALDGHLLPQLSQYSVLGSPSSPRESPARDPDEIAFGINASKAEEKTVRLMRSSNSP